jgi:beta-mannosidase
VNRRIPLDGGDWRCRGFLGVDAADAAAVRASGTTDTGWIAASVPGSVIDDLWRAGEIPDPYVERNSLQLEWVPERAWLYRLRLPRLEIGAAERALIAFDGVDHAAHVFVDDEPLATHEGMFVPFEVDATAPLRRTGDHTLSVVIEPAPQSEPQVGRTSRVRVHKSRMTYGWDFCPRMIHQGIWRPVAVVIAGSARIRSVVTRGDPADDLQPATVDARVTLEIVAPTAVELEFRVLDTGATITTHRRRVDADAGTSVVAVTFDAGDVRPWWPNGMGEPAVYRLHVSLYDTNGLILDESDSPLGFRRFALGANEGAPPDARGYTLMINGRRTYASGWNWTPIDVLYGVPRRERLAHLIRLAHDAGVNLLRVWGGGVIESDEFYDACDRAGILVWQEFAQSSSGVESTPAADAEFVALMAREAQAIVPLRASHPSLAIWCGGNELTGDETPLDEAHPVLAALRDVVEELDTDATWLPTSPSGPRFHNRLDVIAADPGGMHDVHGPWEHQGLVGQYELYNRGAALLNSEFGVEGMTNRRSHERLIGVGHRLPPTRDNPVYRHLGEWWINEPLVQRSFGGRIADLAQLRRASQMLQADGLQYAVESNRRRAYQNSGSLPWQFNESYPNAWCTAAVDHRGDPKPAYYAVRRAYERVHVAAAFERAAWAGCASFDAEVWAWSSVGRATGDVVARVLSLDGETVAGRRARVAVCAAAVAVAPVPAPLFLLALDLVLDDGARSSNRYLFTADEHFAALLDVPAAGVTVERTVDGDVWRLQLSHVSGPAALGVRIEDDRPVDDAGWAEIDDGWLDLLPAERRRVEVRWSDAPLDGRRLVINGWNVEPISVG